MGQSVKILICARGKLRRITGELSIPAKTDPSYNYWLTENSMVLALVNSMEPAISRCYLWFTTAKEVWDAARRKMYSNLGNASQMFEFGLSWKTWNKAQVLSHSTSPTSKIYGKSSTYSSKTLPLVLLVVWNSKGTGHFAKERVLDFLVGLNRELDDVWGRIVARDPFPSPDDTSEVRHEEMRCKGDFTDWFASSCLGPWCICIGFGKYIQSGTVARKPANW